MNVNLIEQVTAKLKIGNYFMAKAETALAAGDKDATIEALYLAVAMFAGAGNLMVQQHKIDAEFITMLPMSGAA